MKKSSPIDEQESYLSKLFFENQALAEGYQFIAGVDEAGRGPLAGPVVAASCILSREQLPIYGLDDSKKLSSKKREFLFDQIQSRAQSFSVAVVDHEVIDQINILQATIQAMKQALDQLNTPPDCIMVDGLALQYQNTTGQDIKALKIIKGDALSNSIAAASILAKVTRDRLMDEYDLQYPQYGFGKHKGYGTKAHYAALDQFGPCPIHRQSFLKKYFAQKNFLMPINEGKSRNV